MANRFPLILNGTQIQEIANGDGLDLTGNSILNATGIATANLTINGQNFNSYLPTALSDLTNDIGLSVSYDWPDITNTPTTLAGYGITDAFSGNYGDLLGTPTNISDFVNDTGFITLAEVVGGIDVNPTGDLVGSVFGDDSTLLVDGINNKIVGTVNGTVNASVFESTDSKVKMGTNAITNGFYGIAIGTGSKQDSYGITVGQDSQADTYGVTVGAFAGTKHVDNNTVYTVALGAFAQQNANPGDITGIGAIAIGALAGDSNQGANSIAIGRYAGRNNQAAKSIVINATDSNLENTTADSLVIKPIRSAVGTTMLMYDATTGEVTHTASPVITGDLVTIGKVGGQVDIYGAVEFTTGTTVDFTNATVNGLEPGGLVDIVSDQTPQLGGELDMNSQDITGTGNINITGTVTATDFVSSGAGTPTLESATDINLDAGNAINLQIGSVTKLSVNSSGASIPGYISVAALQTALQDGAGDYAAFKAYILGL
jgi:hypothetical protein